jgi:hypothetical protein
MIRGVPFPHEVKYRDIDLVQPAVGSGGTWSYLVDNALAPIKQGTGSGNRIGRSIRVVGVVYRMMLLSYGSQFPYTMDVIWDASPKSTIPQITEIYTSSALWALPNPNFGHRFQFAKRLANQDPNSERNLLSGMLECNKVVTYTGNTGSIADVENNSLLVTFAALNEPVVGGTLRVLFVDA